MASRVSFVRPSVQLDLGVEGSEDVGDGALLHDGRPLDLDGMNVVSIQRRIGRANVHPGEARGHPPKEVVDEAGIVPVKVPDPECGVVRPVIGWDVVDAADDTLPPENDSRPSRRRRVVVAGHSA